MLFEGKTVWKVVWTVLAKKPGSRGFGLVARINMRVIPKKSYLKNSFYTITILIACF